MKQSLFSHPRGNIYGGITAAIVALPLALAFGVTSGLGPVAGLYGAIASGFFAALLGGTPTQITGPTGPMTVVVAAIFTQYIGSNPEHGLAICFTIIMLGGLFQILFGLLKLGKYIILVPYPVISGFMSGIGVIIILIQVAPLVGLHSFASPLEAAKHMLEIGHSFNPAALIVGLVTLLVLFIWPKKLQQLAPSPLVALIVGSLLYILFLNHADLPKIGNIPSALPDLNSPYFEWSLVKDMIFSGLLLALLGSIDSLLTSLVADNLTGQHHHSDRELIGQGIGNFFAGLIGGLPGAGATMRTVINIQAGGHNRLAGMIHSLILLSIALGIGFIFEDIPLAVLSGILLKVGIDIIDWEFIKQLHKMPLFTSSLMLGVLFMTVFVDLVSAVFIGIFVTNMVTIQRLSNIQLESIILCDGHSVDDEKFSKKISDKVKKQLQKLQDSTLVLKLKGPMSFGVARDLRRQLGEYTQHKNLLIDLSKASIVGTTTALVLKEIIEREQKQDRQVYLVNTSNKRAKQLQNMGILDDINASHLFQSSEQALQKIIEQEAKS
ncbi:MAG: SulP family inorganic anion transporter [Enterobacterales bacterium]|nr:SulP family inorganic anion transporter [Enterobacterales bacterium]